MWLRQPLSEAGLENIKNHKYVAGKYTPLDNLLNPFWAWATEFLPMWMAPNLVTLLGFSLMIFSYCLCWFYSPSFVEVPPRWVFLVAAFCLWAYQTLDAMDGKQARRTGSSSPMGHLFDHGCDCLGTLCPHSLMCAILVPGSSRYCFAALAALQSGFYLAQLEELFTGILRTSAGFIGVTELQYGLILASLAGAVVGPKRIPEIMHSTLDLPGLGSATLAQWLVQVWVVSAVVVAVFSYMTIIKHLVKQSNRVDTPLRLGHELTKVFAYSSPVVLLNIMFFSWDEDFLSENGRLLCFSTGLLFFYYTAQVVLFSMAHEPFPFLQKTLIPYGVLVYASRTAGQPARVKAGLVALTAFLFIRIFHWLVSVLVIISTKLGIYVLSLRTDYIAIA